MTRAERTRRFLSDWHFWVAIAYFSIVAILVWQISLSNRQAREEAARTASVKSAAVSQVAQCFASAKSSPVVSGFIRSHEAIIENGLLSNEAAIAASPGDPLNEVREKSIARLTSAKANADELKHLISLSTPTMHKCVVLADKLGVDASRYTQTK